jgi:tol-pal system protein YbgF
MRPHRYLIATGVGLLALALGSADATVAGVAAPPDALRSRLDAARPLHLIQADDAGRLARFEVRLARIEEELRQLTGRLEQLEFGQRALEGRMDQLIQDLDQRLLALEGEGGGPTTQETGPTARQAAAPADAGAGGETAATGDETARGGADAPAAEPTLGVVPESAVRNQPPPRTANLPPQEQYDAAMQLLRAGDYPGAERGLQLFLELNPDNALAPNAAYWLAETHYVRKSYAAAAAAFARNYRVYGKDDTKAPDNLLKLGMSLQGLQESEKACRTFAELAKEFPNAPAHIQQAVSRERERADCA